MSPRLLLVFALFAVSYLPKYADSSCAAPRGSCFKDSPKKRALPTWVGSVSSPQACIDRCKKRKTEYAGLQDGYGCWCGTTYDLYGPATNCNKKCKNGQNCGGWSANIVYAVSASGSAPNGACFKDNPAKRALPTWVGSVSSPQACIDICKKRKAEYAGIQDGYGCRCGTTYDLYGSATNCNKKCKNGEMCGGWSANTVYAVSAYNSCCFKDNPAKRALPTWVGSVDSPQDCINKCKSRKAEYAGVQDGYGCRCGTTYDLYGRATNCNKKCKNGQDCGGWSANTVYAVTDVVKSKVESDVQVQEVVEKPVEKVVEKPVEVEETETVEALLRKRWKGNKIKKPETAFQICFTNIILKFYKKGKEIQWWSEKHYEDLTNIFFVLMFYQKVLAIK